MKEQKYPETSRELLEFIYKSPSCFHAAENITDALKTEGFIELFESEKWDIKSGGKYFITRNLSTVIAFKIPDGEMKGFHMAASHCDSPVLKIKENPEIEADGAYIKLNVEKYGGMILSSWLDRPLSAAGRVFVETKDGVQTRLVNIDRDLLVIPSLAIHMNRNVNDGYKFSVQKDMLPLFGDEKAKGRFEDLVAECAGADKDSITGQDLYLYCREKGCIWGADNEYILSPKLDNLQCTYGLLQGFLKGENADTCQVLCVFDNEEVGSSSRQGAASTVLFDTLVRITAALGGDYTDYLRLAASSFMVCADNGHAAHPNHTEVSDPVNHPHMNKGIVLKYSANLSYSTDAGSAAAFKEICRRADVPVQVFHNNSDSAGGRTLGNISTGQVSVRTVDIGLAQLAMHSSYECAGAYDLDYLIKAMTEFYSAYIKPLPDGGFCI